MNEGFRAVGTEAFSLRMISDVRLAVKSAVTSS
jgi:hypothetical protein